MREKSQRCRQPVFKNQFIHKFSAEEGWTRQQEDIGRVGSAERSPSSNRTCGFPASGSHGNLNPSERLRTVRLDRVAVSAERVSPAGAGCSVVGTGPKRNSRLLTETYSRSAPSLHGHYPLPRYYGLSDSRKRTKPAGIPGSSTPLSSRAALNHPGESEGCITRWLDPQWQASSASTDWPLSLLG